MPVFPQMRGTSGNASVVAKCVSLLPTQRHICTINFKSSFCLLHHKDASVLEMQRETEWWPTPNKGTVDMIANQKLKMFFLSVSRHLTSNLEEVALTTTPFVVGAVTKGIMLSYVFSVQVRYFKHMSKQSLKNRNCISYWRMLTPLCFMFCKSPFLSMLVHAGFGNAGSLLEILR